MNLFTIPRHGSRPNRIPTNQILRAPLPGGINVSFYDGHVRFVRLEDLWQLEWHQDYKPPTKRPRAVKAKNCKSSPAWDHRPPVSALDA